MGEIVQKKWVTAGDRERGSNTQTFNQTHRLEWLKPSSYERGMCHRALMYTPTINPRSLAPGCTSLQLQHELIASLSSCQLAPQNDSPTQRGALSWNEHYISVAPGKWSGMACCFLHRRIVRIHQVFIHHWGRKGANHCRSIIIHAAYWNIESVM